MIKVTLYIVVLQACYLIPNQHTCRKRKDTGKEASGGRKQKVPISSFLLSPFKFSLILPLPSLSTGLKEIGRT